MPATVPSFDQSGLTFRTGYRSRPISEPRHAVLVADEFVVLTAGGERVGDVIGREHAGENGVVAAFDPGNIDESGRAADQRAAGKDQLRHRLPAALGDGAGAIGEPACAGKQR